MKRKLYKRKPGDFEIRVLGDGRLVMLAPDETLLELSQAFRSRTDLKTTNLENMKVGKATADKT